MIPYTEAFFRWHGTVMIPYTEAFSGGTMRLGCVIPLGCTVRLSLGCDAVGLHNVVPLGCTMRRFLTV